VTALAAGSLRWTDGMLLEDYLDATNFIEAGGTVPRGQWVAEYVEAARAAQEERARQSMLRFA
jgi:hypothetical protein